MPTSDLNINVDNVGPKIHMRINPVTGRGSTLDMGVIRSGLIN